MPSALFALMAGIAFAGAEILNKRGLQNTSILLGFLVSLASGLLLLFFVLLINPPTSVNWRGTSWFVLAGLVGPGVGRLVGIAAAHRLGPSLSTPIQSIAYPLLALSLSFILLEEPVVFTRVIGVIIIVTGLWHLTTGVTSSIHSDMQSHRIFHLVGGAISLPLTAGLCYGLADIVRKQAIEVTPHAILGSTIGLAAALVAWIPTLALRSVRQQLSFNSGVWWFVFAGLATALATISIFLALEIGNVSLVSPIAATNPLFVFLFSSLFLRDIERLRRSTVIGGIIMVGGTILVSL